MNLPNVCAPRSLEVYALQLDGLDVEHAQHYQPGWGGTGWTHCNALVADACARLGVTVPLIMANDQVDWLCGDATGHFGWTPESMGPGHGWLELVTRGAAIAAANLGQPTIVAWKNHDGPHGHIAMVRPGKELRICQAGGQNFNDAPYNRGFGSLESRFFTHA